MGLTMTSVGLRPERLSSADFADQHLAICGKSFRAHMSGALYWPAEDALIVSDLHLEKGSAFAALGQMLPPYDTRETLSKLAALIDRYQPETVIALGDSLQIRTRRPYGRARPRKLHMMQEIASGSGSPATTILKSTGRSQAM